MGINKRDIEVLIRLRREHHIADHCSIVELGAQQLSHDVLVSRDVLDELGKQFCADGPSPVPAAQSGPLVEGFEVKLDPNAPPARDLWRWLGFTYAAIDFDGSPESIPLDLNFDDVPPERRQKFDIVTNYGTTEHVANQLNAFKIIHDLTSKDGIMIHNLPTQGHMNHGLVNYNPKFFWKLAKSNDYKWLYSDFYTSGIRHGVPANIPESIAAWEPSVASRLATYDIAEAILIVALQKQRHAAFVPPLDMPDGMSEETDDEDLLQRYPTLFRRKP